LSEQGKIAEDEIIDQNYDDIPSHMDHVICNVSYNNSSASSNDFHIYCMVARTNAHHSEHAGGQRSCTKVCRRKSFPFPLIVGGRIGDKTLARFQVGGACAQVAKVFYGTGHLVDGGWVMDNITW
jgi:hypothetical protein